MVTRQSQTKHWASQKNPNISEAYFTSPPATKRSKFFVDYLKNYNFNSIFEVGMMSGRNLYYIKDAFPDTQVAGLEVNPRAVKFAKEKLNVSDKDLLCMDLHDMDNIKESYDIVFSSGVLIHIIPDDLKSVCEKMLRRANKYVMHIEECGNEEVVKGPKYMNPIRKESNQVQWAPDLISIYKQLGYEPKVIELPLDVRTNGASDLIIVKV